MTLTFLALTMLAAGPCPGAWPANSAAACAKTASSECQSAATASEPCCAAAVAGKQPTILRFGATWCAPCRQMAPVVQRLEQQGHIFVSVDVDRQSDVARQHNITSIPAFVAVVNGREVGRVIGANERQLKQLVSSVSGTASPGSPSSKSEMSGVDMTPLAPGAKSVEMLVRARYELNPAKAAALAQFLAVTQSAVDLDQNDGTLTITATPEVQRAVGQFISAVLQTSELTAACACDGNQCNSHCPACSCDSSSAAPSLQAFAPQPSNTIMIRPLLQQPKQGPTRSGFINLTPGKHKLTCSSIELINPGKVTCDSCDNLSIEAQGQCESGMANMACDSAEPWLGISFTKAMPSAAAVRSKQLTIDRLKRCLDSLESQLSFPELSVTPDLQP